jgi:hypothetical protein
VAAERLEAETRGEGIGDENVDAYGTVVTEKVHSCSSPARVCTPKTHSNYCERRADCPNGIRGAEAGGAEDR